ncbi:glycosyltransferase [Brochothrix campestris]|uniref:glycosyltransferase n=1 Tax=Brochothrix campestris TaxID=2757 RepID=UPI0004B57430|nr:glycosyltransferase [Brochothrix campestris]
MRQLNVLVYGDVDLNFIDGSAVWLTSMANMLAVGKNVNVEILLKAKIKHKHLISEMEQLDNVAVIDTFTVYEQHSFENRNRMSISEAIALMKERDDLLKYDLIIVRGLDLVVALQNEKELAAKTIPYITNFEHRQQYSKKGERRRLKAIYQDFPKLFLQTEEMKKAFCELTKENGSKIELLKPMIPNITEQPRFKNNNNKLIYTGKFAEEWYIEELLDIVDGLTQAKVSIDLSIAGDKFQGPLNDRRAELIERFDQMEAVKWHGAVSRKQGQLLIESADLGMGFRSESIDNNESVELSTKLLEYSRAGKPVICRPTKLHRKLLGNNYPLFVNSTRDCQTIIKNVIADSQLYERAAKMAFDAVRPYTFHASYQRLKTVLWAFKKEPIKLLVASHDLKFLKLAIKQWEADSQFEVKIDQWSGHNQHDESKSRALLDWADVIFCEWGLGNTVWYSKNKHQHQHLIVRVHAQENKTVYPAQFNYRAIDKIIAVSPHIYEVFQQKCGMPREKMIMIYNMIDTKVFAKPKEKGAAFNIGLVGILPQLKRLDLALDVLEQLIEKDPRYRLFIKGKLPSDLEWMKNRPAEMAYYDEQFERIRKGPLKKTCNY